MTIGNTHILTGNMAKQDEIFTNPYALPVRIVYHIKFILYTVVYFFRADHNTFSNICTPLQVLQQEKMQRANRLVTDDMKAYLRLNNDARTTLFAQCFMGKRSGLMRIFSCAIMGHKLKSP